MILAYLRRKKFQQKKYNKLNQKVNVQSQNTKAESSGCTCGRKASPQQANTTWDPRKSEILVDAP